MKKKAMIVKCFAMIMQVGITLLAPIILCTFCGVSLDKHFGWNTTLPLLVLGILAGARSAYVLVYKVIKQMEKESDYDR